MGRGRHKNTISRFNVIYKEIHRVGCVTVDYLVRKFGYTRAAAYYPLKIMSSVGLIKKTIMCRTGIWCVANISQKKIYETILKAVGVNFNDIIKVICNIINKAKSKRIKISSSNIYDKLSNKNPHRPYVLYHCIVYSVLKEILGDTVIMQLHKGGIVVDVNETKNKLKCK